MTREQKLALMKNRLTVLESNGKNVKCPGVARKLHRQIRNMEQWFHLRVGERNWYRSGLVLKGV